MSGEAVCGGRSFLRLLAAASPGAHASPVRALDRAVQQIVHRLLAPLARARVRAVQQAVRQSPGAALAQVTTGRAQWLVRGERLLAEVVEMARRAAQTAFLRQLVRHVGRQEAQHLLAAAEGEEDEDDEAADSAEDDTDFPGLTLALAGLVTTVLYRPDAWGMTPLARLGRQDAATSRELATALHDAPGARQGLRLALAALAVARGSQVRPTLRQVERAGRTALAASPTLRQRFLDALHRLRAASIQQGEVSARALRRLEALVVTGVQETVEDAITVHLEQRALRRAEVLARPLATQTFGVAMVLLARQAGVQRMQWSLSPSHPKTDVCDDFAEADMGYGPGVYPLADLPDYPAHSYCLCGLEPVLGEEAT